MSDGETTIWKFEIIGWGFEGRALRERSGSSAGRERQSERSDERKARSGPGAGREADERRARKRGRSTRRRLAASETPSSHRGRATSEPTFAPALTSGASCSKAGSSASVADAARAWGDW